MKDKYGLNKYIKVRFSKYTLYKFYYTCCDAIPSRIVPKSTFNNVVFVYEHMGQDVAEFKYPNKFLYLNINDYMYAKDENGNITNDISRDWPNNYLNDIIKYANSTEFGNRIILADLDADIIDVFVNKTNYKYCVILPRFKFAYKHKLKMYGCTKEQIKSEMSYFDRQSLKHFLNYTKSSIAFLSDEYVFDMFYSINIQMEGF